MCLSLRPYPFRSRGLPRTGNSLRIEDALAARVQRRRAQVTQLRRQPMPNQQAQITAAADHRLSPIEYLGYALGDTASGFFFQTFNIFLTYYYVDVWGIPAT